MSQLICHTFHEGEPSWEFIGEPQPEYIDVDWAIFADEWGNYGPADFAEARRNIERIEDPQVRDRILREWDTEIEQWREMNEEPLPNIVVGRQDDLIQAVQAPPRRPHPNRPPPKTLHSITP